MRNTLLERPANGGDTYSNEIEQRCIRGGAQLKLAGPLHDLEDPADIDTYLCLRMSYAPDPGPTVQVVHGPAFPQVRQPAPGAPNIDAAALLANWPDTYKLNGARRGQPPKSDLRRVLCALELVVILDIEQRPILPDGEVEPGRSSGAGYIVDHGLCCGRRRGRPSDWHLGADRDDTVERWRRAGRLAAAQLGAWPWATSPHGNGRLAHRWWRNPAYPAALERWALGASL